MTEFIHTKQHGGVGYIILNRPKALNALNLEMVEAILNTLRLWANDPTVVGVVVYSNSPKGLCAGGDIRFFYQAARDNDSNIETFFTLEYTLNHFIAHYPKPYVVFMQGIVMGGGMGISAIANPRTGLRVVSDSSKLAMPEIKIGLFPDVGGTHFLSHCNGQLGTYLALTATPIDASSALYVGLADVYCPDADVQVLIQDLHTQLFADADQLLNYVRQRCTEPKILAKDSFLAQHAAQIEDAFSKKTIADIMASLQAQNTDFSHATLAQMKTGSPLLVHATLYALQQAHNLSLADALRIERNLVKRCFLHGEPIEGIRALVIDKDHHPQWAHQHLDEVTQDQVLALFSPVWTVNEHPLKNLAN